MSRLFLIAACVLLSGCVVHTAYDVATAPVRVGSKVVDWSTTSRSEADRNLGRKVRKQQKRDEKEARKQAKRDRAQGEDQQGYAGPR
ncbi:hypothetical protein [Sphingomonas abietis]|uniref:Lipoprotein n=1 Tax=Sphingomonas abietis TaxID=3012344 RepID=A0ABY7NN67_9SPHN|nr:hypothetical protein [Sphingomonas abietis]WBO20946.1 hypothetical protein PBT88_12080 [Sphingomonas abietis]